MSLVQLAGGSSGLTHSLHIPSAPAYLTFIVLEFQYCDPHVEFLLLQKLPQGPSIRHRSRHGPFRIRGIVAVIPFPDQVEKLGDQAGAGQKNDYT